MTDSKHSLQGFDKNKAVPIKDGIFKATIKPPLFGEKEFRATEYICESLSPHTFSIIGRTKDSKFLSIVLPLTSPKKEYTIVKPGVEGVHASLGLTMEGKSASSGELLITRTKDIVDAEFKFIIDNKDTHHEVTGKIIVKPTNIS